MPLNATCTNCGKSYQAPDSMGGKSVRCKACGTVFRVAIPETDAPEPGDLDFDELERSFSGEAVDTVTGRPVVDAKGKVAIKRSSDVSDVAIAGESGQSLRSNYRYRFPMAKQIDQFLPWILFVGCVALLANWCMTTREAGVHDAPPTGVAISRFFLLFGAYVLLVFPAAHIAMHKASRALRFSMPRAAAWRSFTGFMPLLLLGPGMYMLSGGSVFLLIFGIILGTAVSVGAITLLYRLFPNEMPVVGVYTACGAIIGGTFTVAALFAINLVALSVANMSKKEPDLFVSPIALGLRWQENPVKLAVAPKPTPKPAGTPADMPPTTQETPTAPLLRTVSVPAATDAGEKPMISKLEMPPVPAAFDLLVTSPIQSTIFTAIRDSGGGSVDIYNSQTWKRTATSQDFQRFDWSIASNTVGDCAVRIVRMPNYRIEGIPLIRGRSPEPILFDTQEERSILGYINERILLVLVHKGRRLSLERYDISRAERRGDAVPFGKLPTDQVDVSWVPAAVRMTPDGTHILIAGRAGGIDGNPGRLALYDVSNPAVTISKRDLPLNHRFDFRPIGLAITNGGKVAMVLNTDNEVYLTAWQMDVTVDGVVHLGNERQLLDRKLGVVSSMRPMDWEDQKYDALCWLNDQTLLLFGTYIVDASTGKILGETGLKNVAGQIRESENVVLVVQKENGLRQLYRVSFDPDVINAARKQ